MDNSPENQTNKVPSGATEVDLYREVIFQLFETESKTQFSNGAPAHAAVIFEAMLQYAKESVKIFCKELLGEVFGCPRVIMALKGAIERGVCVQVLTQHAPNKSQFLEILKSEMTNGRKSRIATTNNPKLKSHKVNFAVMDEKAFRYEDDASEISAFACANNPSASKGLSEDFDKIYSM